MPNAIVLLSGGVDSTTALVVAKSQGFCVSALSFHYGQRNASELKAAERVAQSTGVDDHVILNIDLRPFGGSSLTDDLAVPKDRSINEMNAAIPSTYVPARNTIFLSYALAFAEVRDSRDIYVGVNALDYSGYPDCRPEYIAAFQAMANLATAQAVGSEKQINIHSPLIDKTKAEIIQIGTELGANFGETVSCYEASSDGRACGHCDACILRRDGFEQCNLADPTSYVDAKTVSR